MATKERSETEKAFLKFNDAEKIGVGSYSVYILAVEYRTFDKTRYYIGYAGNLGERINRHNFDCAGSEPTKWVQKVIERKLFYGFETEQDAEAFEKQKTIEYMNKYGAKRVRGGPWHRARMKHNPPLPSSITTTEPEEELVWYEDRY